MRFYKLMRLFPIVFVILFCCAAEPPRNLSGGKVKFKPSAQVPLAVNSQGIGGSKALPFYTKYVRQVEDASGTRCPRSSDKASKRILQLHNNTGVGGRTKYLLESFFGIVGAVLFSIAYIGYPALDYAYSVFTIASNSSVNIQGLGRQDSEGMETNEFEEGVEGKTAGRFLLVDNLAVPINDCLEWAICIAANQVTGRLESAIVDSVLNIFSGRNGILKKMWRTYRRSGTDRIYTTDAAVSCDQFVCQPFRFVVKILIYILDWNAIIKQTL